MSLLGVAPSDEHKAVLRSLGNGECIFRDLDDRAGRIGIDLVSDELRDWIDTNPTRARSQPARQIPQRRRAAPASRSARRPAGGGHVCDQHRERPKRRRSRAEPGAPPDGYLASPAQAPPAGPCRPARPPIARWVIRVLLLVVALLAIATPALAATHAAPAAARPHRPGASAGHHAGEASTGERHDAGDGHDDRPGHAGPARRGLPGAGHRGHRRARRAVLTGSSGLSAT